MWNQELQNKADQIKKFGVAEIPSGKFWNLETGKLEWLPYKELTKRDLRVRLSEEQTQTFKQRKYVSERRIKRRRDLRMERIEAGDISKVVTHIETLNACVERAKNHSKGCSINIDFILDLLKTQDYTCALSGIKFSGKFKPSIDRISSNIGYHPTNVQIVLQQVNIMKMALSQEEFIFFCREVAIKNREVVVNPL